MRADRLQFQGRRHFAIETGKLAFPHPAPPSGQSSPPAPPPQEKVGAETIESVRPKRKREASARAADGGSGEKESGKRDGTEDQYLRAEVHALEGGERDPEDWLTLSPTELLEHTGEQGWDEIFAAVREKQINQEREVNPTAVGFPLPDDERSLTDWLELAPADMYKESLKLDSVGRGHRGHPDSEAN